MSERILLTSVILVILVCSLIGACPWTLKPKPSVESDEDNIL